MNNKLKEILSNDNIHIIECDKNWCNAYGYEKSQLKEDLLDYLANLEQKVEQYENPDDMTLFYMWLDTKAKDKIKQLQQENDYLKLNNPEMNIEHFRIVKENKRKIDNLRKENEKLLKKSYSDDVKITKAIELISKEFLCYDNESDEYTQGKKVINILNGGDEE